MASLGQRTGTCGHVMALFDTHSKCARCRDKGVGQDPCVEKKPCEICDNFTPDQKSQLATPTYRARKEHQKKISSAPLVDPSTVTVLGQVESGKGKPSDRGESTSSKKKKTSHKSPKKTAKCSKAPEHQSDLKNLDDKWSECFAHLEALFLSKISTAGASGKKKATQPVEAPGALPATRPVEAPSATREFQPTSQDVMPPAAVSTSGRPEVQPPNPTTQPAFAANQSTTLTGVPASQKELVSDKDQPSDHPSPSLDEEGEFSDIQSTGPDQEELLDVDQELSAEHTYRETLRGVLYGLESGPRV